MESPKNSIEISLPKKPFNVLKLQTIYGKCENDKKQMLKIKIEEIKADSNIPEDKKEYAIKGVYLSKDDIKKCEEPLLNYVYKYYFEVKNYSG